MNALRKAVQLVLALHDRQMALGDPDQTFQPADWTIRLDPQAEAQLRDALVVPGVDIEQLRALQHAANGLNYHQFCDALDWPRDDYTKAKFGAFQEFGKLGAFDGEVLSRVIRYHQASEVGRGAHSTA